MSAPSLGIKYILVNASTPIVVDAAVSPTTDWAAFVGRLPDEPSNCLSISDTGGLASDPKWLLDFATVSIVLRSTDYDLGYNKMKDIREAVLGLPASPTTINGDLWRGIIALGNMAFIGNDQKERPMFSANYRCYINPAASTVENRQAF